MSTGWVIGIIVLAISIILSNIMLLKKTANHKMPSLKDLENKAKEKAAQSDDTAEEEGAEEAYTQKDNSQEDNSWKDTHSENKDSGR